MGIARPCPSPPGARLRHGGDRLRNLGAQLFPVTVWPAVGGAVLGIGAVINRACTTGVIARIASGEYAFGLTLVQFFLGCLFAPRLFGATVTTHVASTPAATSLDYPPPCWVWPSWWRP